MSLWGTPINVSIRSTNPYNSDISTADTIDAMKAIARRYSHSCPCIGYVAFAIDQQIPPNASEQDICKAIWYWVHSHIKFVTDEETMQQMGLDVWHPTKELLIAPDALLSMVTPSGDCDDFSILTAALLLHFGFRCCFVTIAADDNEPGKWSHVYCRAYFNDGSYMNMDTSQDKWPGWEHPIWKRKKEWFV